MADIFTMRKHIANVFTVPEGKHIASVCCDEGLQAVGRLFKGVPIIAIAIPYVQPLFVPRKNVIIDNLRGES